MGDIESQGQNDSAFRDRMVYLDYLRSIDSPFFDLRVLLESNADDEVLSVNNGYTRHVFVHDIYSDNSVRPCKSFFADQKSNISALKTHFSTHPPGLRTRVIVLCIEKDKRIDQRVLNALLVHYAVEATFFWALLCGNFTAPLSSMLRMTMMQLIVRRAPLHADDANISMSFHK